MAKSRSPLRGELWLANLDPVAGHEKGGRRPCLIVSSNLFNEGPAGLVVVLPVTSKNKGIRFHVPIEPPEGSVKIISYIKPEDIRSISKERLLKRMGEVSPDTIDCIKQRLRILLDIL